jgi:hypothetical protein
MAYGNYKAGTPTAPEFTVPAGDYKLRVVEAKADTSKGGNEMIKLKLRTIKDDGTDGPSLYDYLVFADSSFWKIDAFLKSAGKHPGDGQPFPFEPEIDDTFPDLVGLEVEASLTVEEYNGRKSNKIGGYLFDSDEDFK